MLLLSLLRRRRFGGKKTGDAPPIRNEPVAVGIDFVVEMVGVDNAGGSQYGNHVVIAAQLQRVQGDVGRNLQAHQQYFPAGEVGRRGAEDVMDAETQVGAGSDDGGLETAGFFVDEDVGEAGGRRARDDDQSVIDLLGGEVGDVIPAERVVADLAEDGGPGAETGRRHRLISTLTPLGRTVGVTAQRLAATRKTRGEHLEVSGGAADDDDVKA